MAVTYSIMVRQNEPDGHSLVRMRYLARQCNVHPEMINRFVRLGLIDPAEGPGQDGEWLFTRETIGMIRKILRLRNELGINFAGIGVVLDLLSRLEELETRLREMETRLDDQAG